jgi:hypothetical protein
VVDVVVVVVLVVVEVVVVVVVEVVVVVVVVVLVVVEVVVVVVVVVVVEVGMHGGSAVFVQEQNVSPLTLHCSRTDFLQALKSAPDKPPQNMATSSEHCFEPQSGGAAFALETKTPAASATVANMTAAPRAILVIVGPPYMAVPVCDIDLGALPTAAFLPASQRFCTYWPHVPARPASASTAPQTPP